MVIEVLGIDYKMVDRYLANEKQFECLESYQVMYIKIISANKYLTSLIEFNIYLLLHGGN